MSFKTQALIFLWGVFMFAMGIIFDPDRMMQVERFEFSPYLALGVLLFGIGSARPMLHWGKN